ncbi:MAG: Ldh family oxidoreductase [Rhodomicrobiaceae bacterium]
MAGHDETIGEAELTALTIGIFRRLGLSQADADYAASILILGDLFGIPTHGVVRVPSYAERLRLGGMKAQPNITVQKVAPPLLRVDGDNGVGPLVGRRALDSAIEAAAEAGMALAVVRGSNHFGAIGPYCYLAAEAGFASIIGSNASMTIAPWGGSEARLGNNPIGFGMPHPQGDPFILDMAMSVAARGKIRSAMAEGKTIPEGWATDAAGRPTTDPAEALKGFLLPIGGHKGYGLALTVDLFAGLLSGAAYLSHVRSWLDEPGEPQNLGHFFLLIDVKRLMPEVELGRRMTDFAGILHATPPADPERPVKLPGEIEMTRFRRRRAEGIRISAELRRQLEDLASLD